MKKTNNKGFSLVELIIVIAIMAVLIGVLAPQFIKYVERSRESTDLQNVEEVKTAVEAWVSDNGENATDDIAVSMTTSGLSVTGPSDIMDANKGLPSYGIDTNKKLKSSKWVNGGTGIKWDYSVSTYKWSINSGSATSADYFNTDGSAKGSSGGSASASS